MSESVSAELRAPAVTKDSCVRVAVHDGVPEWWCRACVCWHPITCPNGVASVTAAPPVCERCGKPFADGEVAVAAGGDDGKRLLPRKVREGVTDTAASCGHPNHGKPDHDCAPFLADVPWALYAATRDRVERALTLIESFDPTSGAARSRVFAADLRRILEGTGG